MERKTSHRKFLRRKYRHYAAAMAGAAIMTGAVLPGIPIVKAADVERPLPPPARHSQTTLVDKDSHKTPTTIERHDRQNRNRINVHDWQNDRGRKIVHNWGQYQNNNRLGYQSTSPIEAVRQVASDYGFDSYHDSFTLLNIANGSATVEAIKHATGQRYLIQLTQDFYGAWTISSVNESVATTT